MAEEITSRFFNVISLFNGFIPIMAIQMTALRVREDQVALVFTKVLDHAALGTVEEDRAEPTDRGYWEKRSTPEIMKLVDLFHSMVEQHDRGIELKYNKHYIGLVKNGVATNYVSMIPQKRKMNVSFRIPRSDEVTDMIDESGIGTLPYEKWFRQYRVIIPYAADIDNHRDLLSELITSPDSSCPGHTEPEKAMSSPLSRGVPAFTFGGKVIPRPVEATKQLSSQVREFFASRSVTHPNPCMKNRGEGQVPITPVLSEYRQR